MSPGTWELLVALAVFILEFIPALVVGKRLRYAPKWHYWAANAAGLVAGMGIVFVGLTVGSSYVWMGGLGSIVGWLSGLKYGLGAVVGQWRDRPENRAEAGSLPPGPIEPE